MITVVVARTVNCLLLNKCTVLNPNSMALCCDQAGFYSDLTCNRTQIPAGWPKFGSHCRSKIFNLALFVWIWLPIMMLFKESNFLQKTRTVIIVIRVPFSSKDQDLFIINKPYWCMIQWCSKWNEAKITKGFTYTAPYFCAQHYTEKINQI